MELTPTQERFVLHWGEMGTRWGINRTVAQVHALLFVTPQPLDADQIAGTLGVSRSNVSTSLRDLQGWGIVRPVSVLGERKDHFETLGDVWEMFQIILDERKRREIDPTLALLRELAGELDAMPKKQREAEAYTRDRLRDLLGLLDTCSTWYTQIRHLPQGAIVRFVKMGNKVGKLLGVA